MIVIRGSLISATRNGWRNAHSNLSSSLASRGLRDLYTRTDALGVGSRGIRMETNYFRVARPGRMCVRRGLCASACTTHFTILVRFRHLSRYTLDISSWIVLRSLAKV